MADNPFSPTGAGVVSDNPYTPLDTGSLGGGGALNRLAGLAASTAPAMPEPPVPTTPQVFYSPSQNKMFVNGALFDADDAQSALDSVPYITQAPTAPPAGYDWQEVTPATYDEYIGNINDPSFGTLMARNFEIGGSNLKLLAGRGAQFLGAEETGQGWVNSALTELYKNQPYQREFTSIEEVSGTSQSHGAIDWFVANLAQQGPMLIESLATAIAGAGIGAMAGGGANPFTATGGAISALMGKESFKRGVLIAARKYMNGQALTNGEKKLLRELAGWTGAVTRRNPNALATPAQLARLGRQEADALLTGAQLATRGGRNQAMVGGAFLGNLGGSYALGVADIYGEVRDTGVGDRFTAALGAIPYAALETLPEFLLAGRILGLDGSVLSPARMSSGGVASRFGKGFAVGGTLEGLTEAGQEAILLSSTGQMGDAEAGKRLINAFAAGFAVGGPLGGVANLRRGEPTNMLNPDAPAQQGTGLAPINPDNPNPGPLEGELLGPEVPPAPDALPPSGGTALPPPTPPVQQVGQQPDFVAGDEGVRPGTPNDTPVQINTPVIPAAQSGQQGLLNVFGDQPTTGTEVQARMEPTAENNTVEQALSQPQTQAAPVAQTQQLELPLEDPIVQQARATSTQPEAQTAMGQELLRAAQARDVQQRQETQQALQEAAIARQQMQEERLRAERQRQFDAAMMQRQEQQIRELETARIEQILAENERLTQENIQLKAPPAPLAQPVQESLPGFGMPYGQKVLQRRQEATQQAAPAPVQQRPDPRQLELPLFANEAELDGMNIVRLKNVARSLGVTGYSNVKKPVLLEKIKEKLREGQQDAVQEPSTTRVDVQEQPETSQAVRVGDTQEQQATAAPRGAERLRATQDSTTERGETQAATTTGQDQTEAAVQQPTDSTQQTRQQDSQEDANLDTTYDSPIEAWEDMGVTNIPLDELPDAQRQKFEDLVNSGAVTYEDTKAIYDEARVNMELTSLQELEEAIDFMDTATDKATMEYAAEILVDFAFFNTDSNLGKKTAGGNPSVRDQAIAYINNTQFDARQRAAINKSFIQGAHLVDQLTGTVKGKDKPWVIYAAQANLLDVIKTPMRAMPSWYSAEQEVVTGETVAEAAQEQVTNEEVTQTPDEQREFISRELEDRISSHIAGWPTNPITDQNKSEKGNGNLTEKGVLENMFANANPEYRTARGPKLKDFFNEDGTLKLRKATGTDQVGYVPTTKVLTKEQQEQARQDIKEAKAAARLKEQERLRDLRQMMGEDDRGSVFDSFDDGLDGMYYRADGEKVKNPVPKGKIKLIVNKLLKSLKVKPKVTIVDNFEDLRVNHPELYAKAAKGRPDFGQVNAIGYSIGDEIIIFADFVQSEQTVKFVVAHEALGHFGFRAFMPRDRLGAIFRSIYKTDPHIRNVANRKMEAGMSLEEAVEEAMADAAAVLDSSVIKRFWYAVKSFLNNLGMTFNDDMARYLIRQARRNLRTGGRGVVGGKQLAQNLKDMADESTYGRYSLEEDRADLATKLFEQLGMNKRTGPYGGFTGFRNLYKRAKANPSDVANLLGEALERVQSLDNMASRSEGLSAVFKIFQEQQALVKRLHAEYEKMTAFSHTPNFFGQGKGPTPEELQNAGELLAYAALYKGRTTTEQMIRDMPNLAYTNENGETVIDYRVFDQAVAAGEVTREDFQRGIEVTLDIVDGQENTDPNLYRPEFEITDNVWRIYQEQRAAVNQAALDVLQANLEAAMDQKNEALEGFKNMTGVGGNAPTSVEIQTLKRIIEEYTRLYKENAVEEGSGRRYNADSIKRAEDFIEEINKAIHNPLKVNDWKTGNPDEKASQFQGERYQDIIDGLERLNGLGMSQNQAYKITNAIQNIYLLDVKNQNAEFLAKRTIMGAYVPFTRRGKFQVLVKAVDANGNAINIDDTYKGSMPYFQVDSREDARDIQRDLDESFGNKMFEVLDADGKTVQVQFVAEYGVARQSQPLTHSVNLAEFVDVLQRLNVNVTPKERERLVVALTRQGERARRSLQRSGVAGWDVDVVRSIAEHLETAGHIAGKTRYRHKLNRIMLDNSMWRGNPEKLKRLEKAMLAAERSGNQERIKIARQEYDAYASMYQYSADVGANKTVNIYSESITGSFQQERKSKKVKTEGRGEVYREEAKRLLAWYSDAANIDQSTEDLLSGEVGSRFKLYAVLFQLGGSFATAFINAISMVTHSIPYLSTYNPYRGYGGGFGITNSAAAMSRASWSMKNPKLADYAYVNDVANSSELQQEHGLTQDEAEALRDATAEGVLQAAQFNALVGTARGGVKSNQWSAGIKAWMSMFSFTEQLNRRTTYLAAYRLERDKQLAAGATQAEAQERAAEFGRKAVNTSQGEYAMYNRPEMARGNLFQYIFMYKQFVIVTVQLMRGLAPKERTMMLGLLILMSGVKGLPFADDLMDLVDTLAQKFGIKMASAEKEIAELIDYLVPGATPLVMRGILDSSGATFSTRLGFGDLIPLTGMFKAGGDPWREAENFLGPMWSAISQTAGFASNLTRYGAEVVGLKPDLTSFNDILKESPAAAIRSLADGYTYLSDGRIQNARGSIIDRDVEWYVGVARMLGFYPASATFQNDLIRMDRQVDAYVKSIKMSHTQAFVKAMIDGDTLAANNIVRMVNEHNQEWRGTEYEIRNFRGSAMRSYRMHSQPSLLRYRKSAPVNIREDIDRLMDIYGIDPADI